MAPMRWLSVAGFVLVMLAGARVQASPVRLTWSAPPECPTQATVVAEVERLLKAGANPNATWESGETAIQAAKSGRHEEIVKMLRQVGARE